LHTGYRIGLGESPRTGLIIHISIFTLISGIFTIFVDAYLQARKVQTGLKAQDYYKEVVTTLMDIITYVKDYELSNKDDNERRVEIAYQILKDPDATISGIEFAINQLPQSPEEMGEYFGAIEILRKRGIFSEVGQKAEIIQHLYGEYINNLPQNLKSLIKDRLKGKLPGRRHGMRRHRGFLVNHHQASLKHDTSLISLTDIEHFLRIALELLSDRNFGVLKWKVTDSSKVAQLLIKQETIRGQINSLHSKLRHQKITEESYNKKINKLLTKEKSTIDQFLELRESLSEQGKKVELELVTESFKLDESQKGELVNAIHDLLDPIFFNPQMGELISTDADDHFVFLDTEEIKNVSLEIYDLFDKIIGLTSEPIVDYLEHSPAISISSIDLNAPRTEKVAYLTSIIHELRVHVHPQVHQTLNRFRDKYKLDITKRSMKKINRQYFL
jgi:hypothetical protein